MMASDTLSSSSDEPFAGRPSPRQEVSLLELLNAILRRWRLVVAFPAVVSSVVALVLLLLPSMFTSSTAFMPEVTAQGRLPAGLAGLAGQFGINLATEARQSAQFYAAIIKSPGIVNRALSSRYSDPRTRENATDSASLLAMLDVEGDSLADSLHNGRKVLRGLVSVSIDPPTNIVTVSVTSRYPALAADVANRFVSYLNDFNATTRQSQARESRRFAEERLADAERELEQAEEAVRRFYERNRTWQQSPQLAFEHERLQRQVRITQEVTLTLRREYETARIGEVNDTPVITLLYPAVPPLEKSGPKRRLLTVLAFLLAGTASVFAALLMEYSRRLRQVNEGQYAEFRDLSAQIRREVARVFRLGTKGSIE